MVTRTRDDPAPRSGDLCVCGVVHEVPIDSIVVGDDWLEQLVVYAQERGWSRPFVFMDANTEEVAGSRVVKELSKTDMRVTELCFPERSGLLADEANVSRLEAALAGAETDSIFSVGSGVITDLTRYVAGRMGREFVCVPTAASMDGYASGVSVMEFAGLKTSSPARPPVAIFAEPCTIAAAPLGMTRAGLGDLLGKASARADWQASHWLYGEYLCSEVERKVIESLLYAATHVEEILEGLTEAAGRFLHGLIDSGIAIAMVGSSRPASGCEHQVSHFWDLQAANGRRAHESHGLQVGYATHFAMQLQLHAFGGAVAELVPPRPPGAGGEAVRTLFAGHDSQVETVIEQKRRYLADNASKFPTTQAGWQAVQESVGEAMVVFPIVAKALSVAGIPAEAGFLGLDARTLKTSFRWANRIRPRYTVLDFLEGQGRLEDAIDAVVGPVSPVVAGS
jgi:glycerol-1-phosphate dehydrogenase [NAD(P)+]